MNEMQAHGLLIPVGSMPIEVWIDKNNSLDELQNFVNGNVDVLRVLGNGVDLWFNKEYLFNGSQPNRAIYATKHMEEVGYLDQLTFGHPVKEGELYSLICGDFVAFGVDEEGEIASLPQETIDKLKETFATAIAISAIRVQSTASIQSVTNQSCMNRFKETRR